jgi:L-fucose isomerase-like protein
MYRKIVTLAAGLWLVAGLSAAQAIHSEPTGDIPELTAFHDVIVPIWHTAYPNKDYAALRGFVPAVNEGAAKIYAAALPGLLRDKEAKWKTGVEAFRASVEGYQKAAAGTDDAALLLAAETLHARYEGLVRLIRPVLPEVDAFHKVLYVVFHDYAPAKAYDKIRGATGDLLLKAEAVAKAALPARLTAKAENYQKAAAGLVDAAKALDAAGKAHDHEGMERGVEKLHAAYQALEAIFE